MAKVIVKKDEENPEPTEVIAAAIIEISAAIKKMDAGRLKRRAILVLLRDQTGLPMSEIERVLNAIGDLEKDYVKPKIDGKKK